MTALNHVTDLRSKEQCPVFLYVYLYVWALYMYTQIIKRQLGV